MWTGVGRRANVGHISEILGNTSTTLARKKFARVTYDTRGVLVWAPTGGGGGEKSPVVSHLVRITANLYFQPSTSRCPEISLDFATSIAYDILAATRRENYSVSRSSKGTWQFSRSIERRSDNENPRGRLRTTLRCNAFFELLCNLEVTRSFPTYFFLFFF